LGRNVLNCVQLVVSAQDAGVLWHVEIKNNTTSTMDWCQCNNLQFSQIL